MLIRGTMLAGSALLMLSACSANDAGAAADATQSASLSGSGEPIQAGLYHVVQTGDVEIDEERCILADNVAAGRFAAADSFESGWIVDRNRLSAGTIDVAAHHPSGSKLAIAGTFEKDSFDAKGTIELKLNGETHVVNTRQRGTFVSPTCPEGVD
jgi:hypothetical protein